MKKLLVALALFPLVARAELGAGTFELAGGSNLGFRSGSVKDENFGAAGSETTDTTRYGLAVAGLYYVIPNLGVGLRLGYSNLSEKLAGVTTTTSAFAVGPEVAYELPVAPEVAVFASGFLGYASGGLSVSGQPSHDGSGYALEVAAGAKYFLAKNFSFNAALAYDVSSLSFDTVNGLTPKTTDSGFGLNVGVSVYFGGASH